MKRKRVIVIGRAAAQQLVAARDVETTAVIALRKAQIAAFEAGEAKVRLFNQLAARHRFDPNRPYTVDLERGQLIEAPTSPPAKSPGVRP